MGNVAERIDDQMVEAVEERERGIGQGARRGVMLELGEREGPVGDPLEDPLGFQSAIGFCGTAGIGAALKVLKG